ncbi:hypothetical protein [Micromonospora rubida]|uniref:hypothetical protein n=1 Tax=Micromonospora rubida TaxID=2697657 RepID=UPI0013783017|nr:hypothetical protein [Micromonospora rubida]NBE79890.1 hypothetical protein [Micromonospora rubida]
MTDPLLWRLAYDVAEAHQPDETGRCRSLLCAGQQAPCETLHNAKRAMELARGAGAVESRGTAPRAQSAAPAPPQRRSRAGREAA